ncbi:Pimeloyl-ACP methyl ester carboxylesterase [Gracilibacillus orientalis]|uniref:Pimeloyl-ACP methyl ester carboxylesterase n=1 Tax=Gracilibacillus orientalis TaxID=334253 RepID=A0A1I4Q503_9BACI|nr:alpha/beta hydrolase [Gracilibacillus orientalis]SFM34936.1 Pimeloyl-ACP methyl ester carboxylesterase [Gracilibacillus orientalis]
MKDNTTTHQGDKSLGSAPIGSFYNVEERRLLLDCSGTGSPSVVFLPAAGMVGLDYLNIHNKISQRTTSVIYDRAGTGWSDPVKLPRSALEVTDELRSLLQTAGVPAPYLFVGHSLGGIYSRRYAQRFPDEVSGMLLLEPPHEDFLTNTPKLKKRYLLQQVFPILRTLLTYKQTFRGLFEQMLASWPNSIREKLIKYHLRTLTKTMTERKNLNSELYEEVRKGGDIPDIPLIVYTAMGIDPFMTPITSKSFLRDTIDPFNKVKNTTYTNLANSVPRGEHRILENAGHTTIHTDCPDEVVEAIWNLLDSVDNQGSKLI